MTENDKITASGPSSELNDRFREYRNDLDLNTSTAAKRLLDAGLQAEGYHPPVTGRSDMLLYTVRWAGLLAFLAGISTIIVGAFTTQFLSVLGLAVAVAGSAFVALSGILERSTPSLLSLKSWFRRESSPSVEAAKD